MKVKQVLLRLTIAMLSFLPSILPSFILSLFFSIANKQNVIKIECNYAAQLSREEILFVFFLIW